MNRKSISERATILQCLCEGMSIRATGRLTGASKNTIVKLLADAGDACLDFQDRIMVDLPCSLVQCDEIWSFCYSKAKNVPEDKQGEFGYGDVWTWVALDADTKLVPCWHVGGRTKEDATAFMTGLAARLKYDPQITTDGLNVYIDAVLQAFGPYADYAQLVKTYGADPSAERRYSPAKINGAHKHKVSGYPDKHLVSTSYVERQNLTMRMQMRRFTRLTNAFSKKLENHMHALSLFYMYYNFARPHKTLKGQTPAMAIGIADHVWSFEEIAALTDRTKEPIILSMDSTDTSEDPKA